MARPKSSCLGEEAMFDSIKHAVFRRGHFFPCQPYVSAFALDISTFSINPLRRKAECGPGSGPPYRIFFKLPDARMFLICWIGVLPRICGRLWYSSDLIFRDAPWIYVFMLRLLLWNLANP
jgi:hypothetical protein